MEVRKGYKQADVGVIPEDWDVKALGELGEFKNGINKGKEDFGFGHPFVNLMDVFGIPKITSVSNFGLINSNDVDRKMYDLKKGDVLFVRSSVKPEGVGLTTLIDEELPDTVFSGFLIRFRSKDEIAHEFKKYCFYDFRFRNRLIANSTVSANTNINQDALKSLLLAFPKSKAEQQAIAAALCDVDALLNSLDALIAKKHLIKQGAMQELLTGRKRLPGFEKKKGYKKTPSGVFPEDWDIVPLKQISSMHGRIGWQGLKQTEFTMNSEQPFLITGMNFKDGAIRWDEVYHVPWDRYEMAKEIQLKTGDVLMTKDGTIGKILFVDEIPYPGKATLNSHLLVFRPLNNKYNPKFLFYQLNSKTFFNHVEQEKSGTTFFGITQEAVGKYNAFLPSLPEQAAIAEILSDMDAEITTLEARREKTRLLKQGMMQELLTGRIRLV